METERDWNDRIAAELVAVGGCDGGVAVPGMAWAQSGQSGITGVVHDASGAVSARSDGRGRQPSAHRKGAVRDDRRRRRVPADRPAARCLQGHLHLPGFTTVVREGIDLPASFTATVNVELKVAASKETVTVTGAARWWT
jgi:hypothetical protein